MPTIRSVVNGTTLAVTLSGLSSYTQYSCYGTANTSVGIGSPSNISTAQTSQSGKSSFLFLSSVLNDNAGTIYFFIFRHEML